MPRTRLLKKRSIYLATTLTCLICGYWLKNSAGINLFSNFSLSAYFPFSLIALERNVHMKYGPINIEEDFESLLPIPVQWHDLQTPEPHNVAVTHANKAPGSSRCLIVNSFTNRWWHITHRYIFAVSENDKFSMQALVWSRSEGGYAEVEVSAFDAQGQVIKRAMWRIRSTTQNEFQKIKEEFTVSRGVASIRLRIAGKGIGEFKFDNIEFERLERDS